MEEAEFCPLVFFALAFSVFMLLKPRQTPQSDKVPDQGWTDRAFTLSLSLQAGMLTALHQEFGEKSVFSDSPVSVGFFESLIKHLTSLLFQGELPLS